MNIEDVVIKYHAIKRFAKRAGVPIKGKNKHRSPLKRKLKKAFVDGEVIQDDKETLRIKLDEFVFIFKKGVRLTLVTVEKNRSASYKYFKRGKAAVHNNKHKFNLTA